jgi:hypothetical protein
MRCRRDESRAMLGELTAGSPQGFDLPDLTEAQTLLEQLGT